MSTATSCTSEASTTAQPIQIHRPRAAEPAGPQRWSVADIEALFNLPLTELIFRAQTVHREHFDPNAIQLSTLLSIKTGGCEEDCKYCPQSAHYKTDVTRQDLVSALQFLVVTFIVLPILPDQSFGPYQVLNPRNVWLMVVLISALNFVSYLLVKVLGPEHGVGLAGQGAAPAGPAGHFGLLGMRERAQRLGAQFRVEGRPGEGTRVTIWFPTRERENAAA